MERSHCLNCKTALYPKQNFCSRCGQRADTNRFTFRELLHQFLVTFTSVERGIWSLLKGTAIRPGQTAIEFVEGKRKRYYNPFTLLAVIISLVLLTNSWFKYYDEVKIDQQALSGITVQVKEKYIESTKRYNEVLLWEYKYLNIFNLLCCPYFSFFLFLFFKKRKRNMAEINVAYLLFCPVALLLSAFLFTPLVASYRNSVDAATFLRYGDLFVQNLYLTWGMTVFFGFKSFGGFLKVLGVVSLSGTIGYILLNIGLCLYIYQGDLTNLKYLFGLH